MPQPGIDAGDTLVHQAVRWPMNWREVKIWSPPNALARVAMARRPDACFDFVRHGIARELRALYSKVLSEAIPDGMAELLKQLDQPTESGQYNDK